MRLFYERVVLHEHKKWQRVVKTAKEQGLLSVRAEIIFLRSVAKRAKIKNRNKQTRKGILGSKVRRPPAARILIDRELNNTLKNSLSIKKLVL